MRRRVVRSVAIKAWVVVGVVLVPHHCPRDSLTHCELGAKRRPIRASIAATMRHRILALELRADVAGKPRSSRMFDYVYTDHAQYTIKIYAKMALFPLILTGPLSLDRSDSF